MKVQVTVNNVRIIEPSILNENEYNIHECEFEFTEEYNGLTKKAVFTNEANETYVETIVDNMCSIPSEVLKDKENVKLGVYAYDVDNEELLLRYSPRPTEFYVHEGSYKEGQNSTPPTPSEIEQLQAQITENANDIDGIIGDIVDINSDIVDIKAEQTEQNTNIQNNTDNITSINRYINEINQDIQDLEANKADKTEIPTKTSDLINDSGFIEDADYVHTDNNFTDEYEAQISQNASDITTLQSTKADKSEIPTNTSDLTNDSGFINKNVNDLVNYTLKTNTGSLIDLEINGTTYVITLSLKDVDGNVISTDTIDLPLESVVVGGSYDAVNKKIVLTLENGNTVDIPVGDLIAGLQTEITSQNKLASDLVDDTNSGNKFITTSEKQAWNGKYDKPVGGIPDTDLSSGVQTSLGKADTAIQQSDLTDYIKNTDYATASKGGVVKSNNNFGTWIVDSGNLEGTLVASTKNYSYYQTAGNDLFIGKGTLENVIAGKELINQTQLEESQAAQDTEIEALQQENAELKQDITNMAKAMYKVDGQGSDITLQNTSENKFVEFGLNGRTEQEQLSGKNLVNYAEATTTSISPVTLGEFTDYEIGKTYTFSAKLNLGNSSTAGRIRMVISYNDETPKAYIGTYAIGTGIQTSTATITITENIEKIILEYQPNSVGIKYYDFQLEEGTTATLYEPYCRTEYQAQIHNFHRVLKM